MKYKYLKNINKKNEYKTIPSDIYNSLNLINDKYSKFFKQLGMTANSLNIYKLNSNCIYVTDRNILLCAIESDYNGVLTLGKNISNIHFTKGNTTFLHLHVLEAFRMLNVEFNCEILLYTFSNINSAITDNKLKLNYMKKRNL